MSKFARLTFVIATVGLAIGMTASVATAAYTGVAYCNVSTSISGNTPTSSGLAAAEGSSTQCATFTASAINFSGDANYPNNYNLGGFLNSFGAASGITYNSGFSGSTNLDNTLWVFTGTANFVNGETFDVVHDDGTEMYVNGINVLSVPGPTGPVTSTFTYTGATGNFDFEFIYTECCGGTADYKTTLVPPTSSTPEPGTFVLLGSGLLGLWGIGKRRLIG